VKSYGGSAAAWNDEGKTKSLTCTGRRCGGLVSSVFLDRGDLEQRRGERSSSLLQFAIECEDRACERPAAANKVARDPHPHRLVASSQLPGEPIEPDGAIERLAQRRVEFVQVPAHALLSAAALVDLDRLPVVSDVYRPLG
jgi:hypothetical protein